MGQNLKEEEEEESRWDHIYLYVHACMNVWCVWPLQLAKERVRQNKAGGSANNHRAARPSAGNQRRAAGAPLCQLLTDCLSAAGFSEAPPQQQEQQQQGGCPPLSLTQGRAGRSAAQTDRHRRRRRHRMVSRCFWAVEPGSKL